MQVRKASGDLVAYKPEKIIRSAQHAGFSKQQAESIESKVRGDLEEGMPTKKLHFLIYKEMRSVDEVIASRYRLRDSIALLDPNESEFERYTERLFTAMGYEAQWDAPLIQGLCITHESDVLAKKDGKIHMVECKHHFHHHRYTGLDVPMRQFSRVIDIADGFEANKTPFKVDVGWVVTNTKVSQHAIDFAQCRDIPMLAWKYPKEEGLNHLIDRYKLYPITSLDLSYNLRQTLSKEDILTVQDILRADSDLSLPESSIQELKQRAQEFVSR